MLLRLLEVDNREMAKINLRDLCSFRCYDVFGNSPSPSNRTRWTVLILFAFFLDTILLCLGMKPFFMPFPFAECAGTSDGEGTSGTTPLIPCREDSPVPSISSQGSSWIEGLYGTTGDERTSNSPPPSSRPQAENTDPEEGAGSSNPLSSYKPSQASLEALERSMRGRREREFTPVPYNETIRQGSLNSIFNEVNAIVSNGYQVVFGKVVSRATLQEEIDFLNNENAPLDSFSIRILGDLTRKKEESRLFKSLLSKGIIIKR